MISWKEVASNLPKTILHGRDATLRVRVKWLILSMVLQLWADVKYHVPTGFVFRRRRVVFILGAMPPPSLGRAALGVWCAWFKPQPQITNQRNHKPKGRFFWFVYAKGIPKEPSLWFVVYVVCLKSDMPHHQRQVRSTGIAKRLFFLCFCFSSPVFFHWTIFLLMHQLHRFRNWG